MSLEVSFSISDIINTEGKHPPPEPALMPGAKVVFTHARPLPNEKKQSLMFTFERIRLSLKMIEIFNLMSSIRIII